MFERIEDAHGFIEFQQVDDFADLHNIEVKPENQRKGYGAKLLAIFLDQMRSRGVTEVILEVRVDNEQAINLYRKFGFEEVSIRKNYYQDGCDAQVMLRLL